MRNLIALMLSCAATSIAAAAPVAVGGLNFELDENLKKATVVEGEYSGEISIPSNISVGGTDYAVTKIGDDAFRGSAITAVTFPSTVDTIGNSAFMSCASLAAVNWGAGIKAVGGGAFGACRALKSLNITDLSAWCATSFEGNYANPINNSKSLSIDGTPITDLVIPEGVDRIGDYAFYSCNSLASVTFGPDLKEIGASAFYYCNGLAKIEIPDNVTTICDNAFDYCNGLTDLVLGSGIERLCKESFRNCSKLTALNIPDNVRVIENGAFYGCSKIEQVNFGQSIDTIQANAFTLCNAIKSVSIPSVESWCRIVFENTKSNPAITSKSLIVNGEELTSVAFPSGMGQVNDYTFQNLQSLESVELPEDVVHIGAGAFQDCTKLSTIDLPESVEAIGESAFSGCEAINNVELPEKITAIPSLLFAGCKSLEKVVIPEGVESVGGFAFQNCALLDSIVFPKKVSSIGSMACSGCTGLKYVEIRNTVATVGYSAFSNAPLEEAWINTAAASYKTFPTTTAIYVPFNSIGTWKEECPTLAIKPAGVIEVLPDEKFTTYYVSAGYTMPAGLEGWPIKSSIDNILYRGDAFAAGQKVPHDTPLLIYAEHGAFEMFEVDSTDVATFDGENLLRGSNDYDIVVKDDAKAYYRLGYDETGDTFGFMPILDNGGFEVLEHTAYLEIPAEGAPAEGFLLEDMDTSGIGEVEAEDDQIKRPQGIYRLDGTRVSAKSCEELEKGFYIIDGEKIFITK